MHTLYIFFFYFIQTKVFFSHLFINFHILWFDENWIHCSSISWILCWFFFASFYRSPSPYTKQYKRHVNCCCLLLEHFFFCILYLTYFSLSIWIIAFELILKIVHNISFCFGYWSNADALYLLKCILCVCVNKHLNINDDEPNSTVLTGRALPTFIDSVFDCSVCPHHTVVTFAARQERIQNRWNRFHRGCMFSSKVQATLWQSQCVVCRRMRVHVCCETELRIAFGNGLEKVNSVLRALVFFIYIHTCIRKYVRLTHIRNRSQIVRAVFHICILFVLHWV